MMRLAPDAHTHASDAPDNSASRTPLLRFAIKVWPRAAAGSTISFGLIPQHAGVGDSSSSASRRRSQRQGQEGGCSQAVVVRTVKEIGRADGSFLRFDQNSAVLVNPQGEPIGTRIFGPSPANCAPGST